MTTDYPTLSLFERDRRWQLTKRLMKEEQLDCLIVAGLQGREQFEAYLTNEHVDGVIVFPLQGQPICLASNTLRITRHIMHLSRGGTSWLEDWRVGCTGANWVAVLKERGFDSATIGIVGLDSKGPGEPEGYIPYRTWAHVLEGLPNATFIDVSQKFGEL